MTIATFADLLAPITPEEFFRDYYGRKALHIPGAADKFAGVMSWERLNRLLNMTAIWSQESILLKHDTQTIPPQAYSIATTDRREQPVLQPDPAKVMEFIRRGASFGLNNIDTLDDGLRTVGDILESALAGKAQANLYCSRKETQAFGVHFDTHDVFAMHCEGEKEWQLYETMEDNPINHPAFKKLPMDQRRARAGKVAQRLVMKPGDLLYVPRGLYHDALCLTDGCVHIAYGVTTVIGIDVLTLLSNRAPGETLLRQTLPNPSQPDYEEALKARLNEIGDLLKRMASDGQSLDFIRRYQGEIFRNGRGGFDLPIPGAPDKPKMQPQQQRPPAMAMAGGPAVPAQARAAILSAVKGTVKR